MHSVCDTKWWCRCCRFRMTDYYVFIVEAAVSSLISSTRSQLAARSRNASMPVLRCTADLNPANTIIRSKSGQKNAHAAHTNAHLDSGVVGLFPLIIKIPWILTCKLGAHVSERSREDMGCKISPGCILCITWSVLPEYWAKSLGGTVNLNYANFCGFVSTQHDSNCTKFCCFLP